VPEYLLKSDLLNIPNQKVATTACRASESFLFGDTDIGKEVVMIGIKSPLTLLSLLSAYSANIIVEIQRYVLNGDTVVGFELSGSGALRMSTPPCLHAF
jgi:hypothetical protein